MGALPQWQKAPAQSMMLPTFEVVEVATGNAFSKRNQKVFKQTFMLTCKAYFTSQ